MLTNIRPNVFETNSSSTHSLVVCPGDLDPDDVAAQWVSTGKISIRPGEFGWEEDIHRDTKTKLSYLCTAAKHDLITGYTLADFIQEVENWTGCAVEIEDYCDGYIDHQSQDLPDLYLNTADARFQFLFHHKSYIETDNDNH
jgi:hypothetical protein